MLGHRAFAFLTLVSLTLATSASVKPPTVVIAVLLRNKAHTLPYFLTLLHQLDYPKDRIVLWLKSDHNVDRSLEVLNKWLGVHESEYHGVETDFVYDIGSFGDESSSSHWSAERFKHVIKARQDALTFARNSWADYVLMLDADAFLTDPLTLRYLIERNVSVAAPLLKSDGLYSNFWHGMTLDYYYERTDEYKPVVKRERIGCFAVPMVHSCVLIDLRRVETDRLTYDPHTLQQYDGPNDDIIAFAVSARRDGVPLHICNEIHGYITVPLEAGYDLEHDKLQLINLKLEVLNNEEGMHVEEALSGFVDVPVKDRLGFDKIYMINLKRRPERRKRMTKCFDELGLEVVATDAVDGQTLDESFLQNIKFLPEYKDPYHKRAMTLGEIGCFMSHYNIWKAVIESGYETVLILEDDIRFEPFFRTKVSNLMDELKLLIPDWDLVYFGRKRLVESGEEPWIENARYLVDVSYSYWTLGYALSGRGAAKLLDARPLDNLIPVDEYFPVLFDRHPQTAWMDRYPVRDLRAYSAAPLLLYPTHYTGETGYISDTEDSVVIDNEPKEDL